MKRKHLFASVVMATVLAGCSQEEIANVNNEKQDLGNRPMVEAPVVSLGSAQSRMTTSGAYAKVDWQPGDGFGAAVMDIYNADKDKRPASTKFDEVFTVVDYINSNVLFQTEDGSSFYADASMPEGNHLFYAPFNKENISRKPLATQVPLEQVVANPSSDVAAPSNDIITAFYEDKTSPVFVAYDKVFGEAKAELDLQMRHIYSLPLVTLKFGDVQLLDENGVVNVKEVEDELGNVTTEPVYESEIIINSIEFAKDQIATKGAIKNSAVKSLLAKTTGNNVAWDAVKYETAKTSDILMDGTTSEKVVVTFTGGQKLTADQDGYFFMVLPGDEYTLAEGKLKVTVNATINGESYTSAVETTKVSRGISPAKDVRLLPGQAYSADEYNADGTMKDTKGTSMTYVIDGTFAPTKQVVETPVTGYVAISTYAELESYINKVAYRGEPISEISKDEAESQITAGTYDARKNFVITATDAAPIALDDKFIETFKNSCVISGKEATITFLGAGNKDYKKLVLGDITWTTEATQLIKFSNGGIVAAGNVVMKDAPAKIYATVGSANVTLESKAPVAVDVDWNATVNVNSDAAHNVSNLYGTVNVNVSTAADIDNNERTTNTNLARTLNIADGVTTSGTIKNGVTATAVIGKAKVAMENNGKVTLNNTKSKLTVTGNGEVDNTIGGIIEGNEGNTIYATVSSFANLPYDKTCGLNKLVVTGTVSEDLELDGIKTIDFNAGSGVDMGNDEWDWTGKTININAAVKWEGRTYGTSVIKVDADAVKDPNNQLTIVDINVKGFRTYVANAESLAEVLNTAANKMEVVLAAGTFDVNLGTAKSKNLTIVGTGDTELNLQFSGGQNPLNLSSFDKFTIRDCKIGKMATKNWGHLVFGSSKNANGVYTISNCTFEGVGTQGIYINEEVSGATYNIENCTFNGDFSGEGAITIQNNDNVNMKVNVKNCTFNEIPSTSHKIFIHYAYDGWTLNTDLNSEDIFWKAK